MEKIFDIAKDKEQSWGTLATAIDGNFDEIRLQINMHHGEDYTEELTDNNMYIETGFPINEIHCIVHSNKTTLIKQ